MARRALNIGLNAPIIRALEKRFLNAGTILTISEYTRQTFALLAGRDASRAVLPVPVDTDLFKPRREAVVAGRIGFAGRLADRRKNVELLLRATRHLLKNGVTVSLDLIGHGLSRGTSGIINDFGIGGSVRAVGYLSRDRLAEHLQTLDVFVVPSHQEGLCIAALEAMACGCPVVSTTCGGPEEFVRDGQTGFLTGFNEFDMAAAIARIVSDRVLRDRLGERARCLTVQRYNREAAASVFWENFDAAFTTRSLAT